MTFHLAGWFGGDRAIARLSPEEFLRAFRWGGPEGGAEGLTVCVLTLAALAVLGYLAYRLLTRFLKAASGTEAWELFESLSRTHGLTRREKKLLRGLAHRMGLEDPAVLFVRKSFLAREARKESQSELEALMHKLFD
jgi:hypothetical protein